MKKIEDHTDKEKWVSRNESFEEKLDKIHAKDLGLDVPEDYFSTSKNDILEKLKSEKETKGMPKIYHKFIWLAAAGIALVMALSVFKPYAPSGFDPVEQTEIVSTDADQLMEEDMLVASLFVDESQIDSYVDQYIVEESIIDEFIEVYFFEDIMNDTLLF
ncbi:MAG: hypothetical protein WBN28_10960 [Lutimonas sp.]